MYPRIDQWVRCLASSIEPGQFEEIENRLVVYNAKTDESLPLYEYDEATNELRMPWSCMDLFPASLKEARIEGAELPVSIFPGDNWGSPTAFVAREGQEEAILDCIQALRFGTSGALLIAAPGKGKTVMGTEIALRMGRSTCILVHKEFLAGQWEKAIELLTDGKARVGRLQRDRCDYGPDFDFVIAVTQSVTNPKREYPEAFYESFGLVIADEVHRYGAGVWQHAITRFPARYRLGLTATPRRYDGMMAVITHHIGEAAHEMAGNSLTPRVHFVTNDVTLERGAYINRWNGEVNRGKLITSIASLDGRNESIVRLVKKALDADRKVLLLSERRNQLAWLSGRIKAYGWPEEDIGFYVGSTKQEKLDIAATKKLILGTYQMAKEGLDIPDLDTLFLATPMVDVEQSVGRILRTTDGKKEPVVIDFIDSGVGPLVGMAKARRRLYERLEYTIE